MAFEKATIKVEKEREFGELKAALSQVFAAERVEKYLKGLDSRNIRIRNFDAVLAKDVIDSVGGGKAGLARALYHALPVSDQAQMREFYLSRIEEVEPGLRARFHKVYQYY
jgi:hypothetical protein